MRRDAAEMQPRRSRDWARSSRLELRLARVGWARLQRAAPLAARLVHDLALAAHLAARPRRHDRDAAAQREPPRAVALSCLVLAVVRGARGVAVDAVPVRHALLPVAAVHVGALLTRRVVVVAHAVRAAERGAGA